MNPEPYSKPRDKPMEANEELDASTFYCMSHISPHMPALCKVNKYI